MSKLIAFECRNRDASLLRLIEWPGPFTEWRNRFNNSTVMLTHSEVFIPPLDELEPDLISELDDFIFWVGQESGFEAKLIDRNDNIQG